MRWKLTHGFSAAACRDAYRHMRGQEKVWHFYAMATVKTDGGRFVKFGVSATPAKRVKEVQVGCPLKIEKAFSVACASRKHAFDAERKFHERFRDKGTHGEWFKFLAMENDEFASAVKALLDSMFPGTWRAVHWKDGDPLSKLGSYSSLFLAGNRILRHGT